MCTKLLNHQQQSVYQNEFYYGNSEIDIRLVITVRVLLILEEFFLNFE